MFGKNERLHREEMLRAVRDEVNKREELFREDRFESFLFHEDIAEAYAMIGNDTELNRIKQDFLRDKRGLDMLGRFELALSDKYLGVIHVVELGHTTKPGENGELDGLKQDYGRLKDRLVEMGLITDELSREDSHRFFDVEQSRVTNERILVGRTRPLISTSLAIVADEDPRMTKVVHIDIAKRMAFSIPTGLYAALADPQLTQEKSMVAIEELLEKPRGKKHIIDGGRTTYLLRTALVLPASTPHDVELTEE